MPETESISQKLYKLAQELAVAEEVTLNAHILLQEEELNLIKTKEKVDLAQAELDKAHHDEAKVRKQIADLVTPDNTPASDESAVLHVVGDQLQELLSRSIEDLEISVRTTNCLREENIYLIGDLVQTTKVALLQTPNIGQPSIQEIEKALRVHNLSLGMTIDNWARLRPANQPGP